MMKEDMFEFKRDSILDFAYKNCIYSGIINSIDFERRYGKEDKTIELEYIVGRYCEEEIVSGKHLKDKLEEYKDYAGKQYGTKQDQGNLEQKKQSIILKLENSKKSVPQQRNKQGFER